MKTAEQQPQAGGALEKPQRHEEHRDADPFISVFFVALWFLVRASLSAIFALFLVWVFLTGCAKNDTVEPPAVSVASVDPSLASNIESSRSAVRAAPNSAEAWGKLGQAFQAAEFSDQARTCYARAASLEPKSVRWVHLLALSKMAEQPEEAISDLRRAAELAEGNIDAPRFALARALNERGHVDEAAAELQKILAANPSHTAARVELARIKLQQNDLNAATTLLEPAVTNSYTARPAIVLLAQIQQREGNHDAAAQLSRRAASMARPFDWPDPFLREVQSLRADRQRLADQANALIQQQRTKEAEALLAKLLNAIPDDPEGLLLLGRLKYVERDCPGAEQALRRHLAAQPNSLNGLIQLGISLLCQQRWKDAESVLGQAVALKPDFAQAHANLGHARSRMGDSAGAIRAYGDALRCNPGDVNSHIALAEELRLAGKRDEAKQHLDRAEALNPKDPRIRQLRERL